MTDATDAPLLPPEPSADPPTAPTALVQPPPSVTAASPPPPPAPPTPVTPSPAYAWGGEPSPYLDQPFAAPTAEPVRAARPPRTPAWFGADWTLAALGAVTVLVLVTAFATLFAAVLGMVATGKASAIGRSVVLGPYLAFAGFGVRTVATSASDAVGVGFDARFLPILWLAVPWFAVRLVVRFAASRMSTQRSARLAFVAKLALVVGLATMVLAHALRVKGGGTTGVHADVDGVGAFFFPALLVLAAGFRTLAKVGTPLLPASWRPDPVHGWTTAFRDGILAYLVLALALLLGMATAAEVVADTGTDRGMIVLGLPFVGANLAADGVTVAMGAPVAGKGVRGSDVPVLAVPGEDTGNVSLLHLGFPPTSDSPAAPAYLFLALLIAPLAVAALTRRRLERTRPATEQVAVRTGFLVAAGFALASGVLAHFGRVDLAGQATGSNTFGGTLFAASSLAGAIGFAVLWGLVGGVGSALWWSRRRSLPWRYGEAAPWMAHTPAGTSTADRPTLDPVPGGPVPAPGPAPTPPPGWTASPGESPEFGPGGGPGSEPPV